MCLTSVQPTGIKTFFALLFNNQFSAHVTELARET